MALAGIPISENECIGDSLQTINNALTSLDTAVAAAAGSGVTQIVAGSNISISPTGGTGVVTINGAEAGASVTVQSTPPSSPSEGDLWFDNDSGILSMYYDSTWVDVGGGDSANSLNVVDSPTIDLSYNSSTGTLIANIEQNSIRYSHLASWQTLSGSPTLSAEAVQPRLAKAWILGTIGINSGSVDTLYQYNCSLVYVRAGVVRVLFHQPFSTQNSYVFSWGSFDAGTTHHFIAETSTNDSGLGYSRQDDEIVLGAYVENGGLETTANVRINAVFFGV
jgi:hypothetical protein